MPKLRFPTILKISPGSMLGFVRYSWQHMPYQLSAVLALMLVGSVTEGASLLLLLPILKLINPANPTGILVFPTGPFHDLLGPQVVVDLGLALFVFVAVITTRAVLMRQKDISTSAFLFDLANRLRNDLFEAVTRARWAFLVRIRGSDISHAMTADIDRVQITASQLLQLAQTVAALGVYAGVALVVSPSMTLIALAIGAVVLILLTPVRRIATRYGATLTLQRQEQYRIVTEFSNGLKFAKASNTEPLYVSQLSGTLREMRDGTLSFMRLYSISTLLFQIGTAAGLALFIWLGVGRYALPYSSLIALVLLFVRIGPRVAAVHGSVQSVLTNLPALDAMLSMRDAALIEAEQHADGDAAPGPVSTEAITFDDVRFAYAGVEAPFILDGVSFQIPANQVTAIIGPSGSGKSTLADLLMGLLEPTSGMVRIDDIALTPDNRRAWRNGIAYVPQDSFLLHDTIAANLRAGKPEIAESTMWEMLELADATALVRRLPHGLATVVGDRGIRLSGGERQRIALARALLRAPRLLVLDEATSALDWESQAAIAAAIRKLRGKMTIVTIAHRPSMIAFADRVVAIDAGRVLGNGPYGDLLAAPDSYLARVIAGDR